MNIKMIINSQLLKQLNLKSKLSKQAEQKQNHRCGDHLEGDQLGGGRGRMGEKSRDQQVQIGRYRVDRGMLSTVWKWSSQRTYMPDPWT